MKIYSFLYTSLVLGFAAVAVSQEVDYVHVIDTVRDPYGYGFSHRGVLVSEHDCEADCQIQWSQFRNGCLWENYCAEKQDRFDHLIRRHGQGVEDNCRPASAPFALRNATTCGRSVNSCRSECRRERILSFDLFRELLGWRQCDSCSGSCCDRSSCTMAAAPLLAIPEPLEADPGSGEFEPAIAAPGDQLPDEPVEDEMERSRSDSADDASWDSEVAPVPVPSAIDQPALPVRQDPAPAVPRNKLPKTTPAAPRSSRRATIKTLVAERLSDYIKI